MPSTRAIAGSKLLRDVLVTIRNTQWCAGFRFGSAGIDVAAPIADLRFRDFFLGAVDLVAVDLVDLYAVIRRGLRRLVSRFESIQVD